MLKIKIVSIAILCFLANIIFSRIFIGSTTYIINIVLWSAYSVILLKIIKKNKIELLNHHTEITKIAFILGVSVVFLQVAFGFFSGFGFNPIVDNLYVLIFLTPMIVIFTSAIELTRLTLVKVEPKNDQFQNILLTSLVCTLISIRSFNNLDGLGLAIFFIETLLPLLAINFLATNFAHYSGFPSAFVFAAIPSFFIWFSPILPTISWAVKPLISIVVASIGYLVLDETKIVRKMQYSKSRFVMHNSLNASWIIILVIGLVAIWGSSGLFGAKPTVVLSESMVPTLNVGDMPIVIPAEPSEINVGDVIQFRNNNGIPIVHRVAEKKDINGVFWFMTKGDANEFADSDVISQQQIDGKVGITIPKIGWITIAINKVSLVTFSAIGNLPGAITDFGIWLFSQGIYLIVTITLAAFSALFFSSWKNQRSSMNET